MRHPRLSIEQEARCKEIRCHRDQLKLEISEMAEKLGISAFRLDKIEKGIQPCSGELLEAASELRWPDRLDLEDDDYYFSLEADEYDEYLEDHQYEERAPLEFDDEGDN